MAWDEAKASWARERAASERKSAALKTGWDEAKASSARERVAWNDVKASSARERVAWDDVKAGWERERAWEIERARVDRDRRGCKVIL